MQNGRPGNDVASLRVKLDALIKRKAPKPVIDAARKKLKRMYGGTRIMKGETAFAMGVMNRGRELMVFDWDKAARMIKERKPIRAGAGLHDKWENTGGEIFVNGKVVKNVWHLHGLFLSWLLHLKMVHKK